MKLIKTLKLSADQLTLANELMDSSGECPLCKKELLKGDAKFVLAEPYSHRNPLKGSMMVTAACEKCGETIKAAIKGCKA